MASKYSVSLDKLIKEFGFETLYLPEDAHDLSVTSQDVNRPGLILFVLNAENCYENKFHRKHY